MRDLESVRLDGDGVDCARGDGGPARDGGVFEEFPPGEFFPRLPGCFFDGIVRQGGHFARKEGVVVRLGFRHGG
jgi:hypothetical protein